MRAVDVKGDWGSAMVFVLPSGIAQSITRDRQ
jgi:hypothetical protein